MPKLFFSVNHFKPTFAFYSCVALSLVALARGESATSFDDAEMHFKLQGEYMGVVDAWGGTWGAQVVAKGEKNLEIHMLEGGLPGHGYENTKANRVFQASIDSSQRRAVVKKDSIIVLVQPNTLEISDETGKKLGVLSKMIRESKTLGARPPKDAVVLFDAYHNDFAGATNSEDGVLGVGGTSKTLFEDHHLHIEFRVPFQPNDKGQARGNSGVYIQGRYEVQILDSFGLAGENNECGGVYTIAKPTINMCYPPLSWQTYDIDFKAAKYNVSGEKISNAKLTVRHNGVIIHDSLDLEKGTPGKDPESDKLGPLFLQDHGNQVVYRNIWVQTKSP